MRRRGLASNTVQDAENYFTEFQRQFHRKFANSLLARKRLNAHMLAHSATFVCRNRSKKLLEAVKIGTVEGGLFGS